MDPWDLLEPVDISSKLPNEFEQQLSSKKWQERKEVLDSLNSLLNENPRLKDSPNYAEIVQKLIKVLGSDANINVAAIAAKCLTAFAKGLRGAFTPYAQTLAPVIFDKFKEKKAVLRDALVECLNATFASTNLNTLSGCILEALAKPNPNQKSQLDQFIYRVFCALSVKDIPKGLLKDLVPGLLKHTADPDPEVRDSSYAALGAMMKCIGEKALSVFMGSAITGDATKMAKINEYKDKALSEFPPPITESVVVEPSSANPSALPPTPNPSQSQPKAKEHIPPSPPVTEEPAVIPCGLLEPIDISSKLPNEFEKQLSSKNWQERKESLDLLNSLLDENLRLKDSPNCGDVVHKLIKVLGSDANINVAAIAAKCLTAFAKGLRGAFTPYARTLAPVIFDKFKEKKAVLRDALVECLNATFASTNLNTFSGCILDALAKPYANQKSQLDQFLYRVFCALSAKDIPKGLLKDLVPGLIKHTADSDSEVRDSSYAALGAIMKCVGEKALSVYMGVGITGDATKMAKITEYKNKALAMNQTMNNTTTNMGDVGVKKGAPQQRARSASGHRRSIAVLPNNSMLDCTSDGAAHSGRRTIGGMSSAVSYASNLNSTFSAPQGAEGKFQLDPKFFQNDFEDSTLVVGSNNNKETTINSSINQTPVGQHKVLMARDVNTTASGGARTGTADQLQSPMDLQQIKPVVRPTSTFSRRSESVSSISSLESAEHIDRTVHNVSCLQLNIAEEAIAQLLHLLNDPTNRQYIIDRTELILKTMVTQIFHIRSQHFEQLEGAKEGDPKEAELGEFMRSICNFLTSLTKEVLIMQRISTDTLRSFIDAILSLVTDQRLTTLNKQIFRSLNIVVIRLCEHTNPTVCFLALTKLIMKYQASDPEGKMLDLVRKCLIKHNDVVADPANAEKVDILTVFEAIHTYYSRFYVVDEQTQVLSESVKNTAKSLCIYIQRIVVNRKYAILNYLYPFPENSHLVTYVRRCVRAVGKKSANVSEEKSLDGWGTSGGMCEELTNIFKRISEDIFCGAVEDLYNFMDVHPEQNANFEQLMGQCDYASIVRRAFGEIRQNRLKREPIQPGVCVSRALPEETRHFLEQQNTLNRRMDDLIQMFYYSTGGASSSTNTTATASSHSLKSPNSATYLHKS